MIRYRWQISWLALFFTDQPMQKSEVLFIAVRREIEVAGNADELLLFNRLLVLLHKRLIGSPGNPRSPDRVSFRPHRNLVPVGGLDTMPFCKGNDAQRASRVAIRGRV